MKRIDAQHSTQWKWIDWPPFSTSAVKRSNYAVGASENTWIVSFPFDVFLY